MNERVDRETVELRRNILRVLRINSLEEFRSFVSSLGLHEQRELKISMILKMIILLYKEKLNLDLSAIKKEFDLNSSKESLNRPIEEVDCDIDYELDIIIGLSNSFDETTALNELFQELERGMSPYLEEISEVLKNNKINYLNRGKTSANDNEISPDNALTELLYLCIEYLLISKLVKENDIFGTTSKQP
jgi:hypothetical protein